MGKNLRCGTVGVVSASVGDADGVTTCCFLFRGFSGVDGGAWIGGGRLCKDVENHACVEIDAASGLVSEKRFSRSPRSDEHLFKTIRARAHLAAKLPPTLGPFRTRSNPTLAQP